MLNVGYVPSRLATSWVRPRPLPPRIRGAQRNDWPALRHLLLSAGVSLTGLAESLDTILILEQSGKDGAPGEIVGCVAVEPGPVALIRSLVLTAPDPGLRHETLLLGSALHLAQSRGAREAVLVVETTAQLPAQHQGLVLWDALRKQCPASSLVRELGGIDSTALAVRLTPDQVAKSCAIR